MFSQFESPSYCIICGADHREDGSYTCSHPYSPDGVRIIKEVYRLTERTFLNKTKTKAVNELSSEAAFLLGPAGHIISNAYAEQIGLLNLKQEEEDESPDDDDEEFGATDSYDRGQEEAEETVEDLLSENGNGDNARSDGSEDAGTGGEQSKAARPDEDKSQHPEENKGVTYVALNRQLKSALTILENKGILIDVIPNMTDAELLDVEGISLPRLQLIREQYPSEDNDAVDDDSASEGTL